MNKNFFIQNLIDNMTLEQKIGQCVVVGMSGTVITNDLREAITRYQCSGIRLSPFTRIFRYFTDEKAKQQFLGEDFTPSMQKIAKKGQPPYLTTQEYVTMLNELRALAAQRTPAIPLHMVIDQEGDTSKDYSRGGVLQFPSSMGLAASRDVNLAYEVARAIGRQLKAAGLDMIHSPVVDVNINPQNPEIGVRAYSDDPEIVAQFAIAQVKGFQEEGIIAAAKHFPGRGDSTTDAHHACPVVDVDRARFDSVELYPYKKLIEAGLDSIMVAHTIYPQLDPDRISTVSRRVVHDLLRNELGFEGVITTDSMTMGALIEKYGIGNACASALAAGADIILMKAENLWRGEMFHTIYQWVEEGKIDAQELDEKVRRVLELKQKYGLFDNMGITDPEKAALPFSDPINIETCKKASRKAILTIKDDLKALPLDKSRKVLLINQLNTIKTPNDSYDHPSLFSQIMEENWPELVTYETEFEFNEEDENAVLSFVANNKFDLILCTNFYDRAARPHTYPRKLIEAGFPVVLISNTPYCIKNDGGLIPEAPTAILNMNLTPEGYRTLKQVLEGQLEPEGNWPLKTYNPFHLQS